ncbi:CDP-alcohol phosphatidyltransferase family protein [Gramella jeungdoensis]|uniref:CDP-alcohol phosphatidyltransferase family protein n=1 Tax=Gramella jeungdoensis TaxID=708091 RepID=A0ABT0Z1E8_9FLAO|nr:CDP-alcohol phosphatidyltransferase family protein [Gramella jeungdoensis]MCM8569233.1 CDP-alcohol phosphatidyltransferase family protein [Gramella jeungdoensis]
MGIKRHIPNLITLLNLFSGSLAVIFAVKGNLVLAAIFVAAGIFFDFFDGLAARLLDVKSEVGLQLDSLADVVTSGVVPGIVMYQLLTKALPADGGLGTDWNSSVFDFQLKPFALLGLLIVLASAYRLAKFNVDDRQTDSFIGLPTPANALLILSLPLILTYQPGPFISGLLLNEWFLLILTVLSCFLLNAELPLFALKFSDWGFKENKLRYFFILSCILLIVFLKFIAIPVIILLYVGLSLFTQRANT